MMSDVAAWGASLCDNELAALTKAGGTTWLNHTGSSLIWNNGLISKLDTILITKDDLSAVACASFFPFS